MSKAKPSYVDKDYEGEDDARSLMRAHEVMSDSKRHGKAKKHLDKMHEDKRKESLHAKAAKGLKAAFPDSMPGGKC